MRLNRTLEAMNAWDKASIPTNRYFLQLQGYHGATLEVGPTIPTGLNGLKGFFDAMKEKGATLIVKAKDVSGGIKAEVFTAPVEEIESVMFKAMANGSNPMGETVGFVFTLVDGKVINIFRNGHIIEEGV